jgi:hypothetical protein
LASRPIERGLSSFHDVVTGDGIRPTAAGDSAWMFPGEAFQALPVAILQSRT